MATDNAFLSIACWLIFFIGRNVECLEALTSLDGKARSEMIEMARKAVADMPRNKTIECNAKSSKGRQNSRGEQRKGSGYLRSME